MIIFLYGEDNFRSAEKLKQLKEEFFKKNTSNATSSVFDFSEGNFWKKVEMAAKSNGLFAQSSLVIIKNFLNNSDSDLKDEVLRFLNKNGDETGISENFIIFWENGTVKKNDKAFKCLIKNAKSEEFNKLSGIQLKNWIEKRLLSSGINIDGEIINSLINDKNGDLFAIDKEIEKIVDFVGQDEINSSSNEQIKKLLNFNVEANIFQTIEFIASGNKQKSLELLHNQLAQGSDPFYILSMYIYQLRNLLKIAEFYYGGNLTNAEIAKAAKLYPFVVQKSAQQLSKLNFGKLKYIYQQLEKIDEEAKSGKMNIEMGLDLLIAKM